MRSLTSALLGAVFVYCFQTVAANAQERVVRLWTDDIPVGRPIIKPPLPARKMSQAEFAASQRPQAVPVLPPFEVDAVRTRILEEITKLKAVAVADVRRQALLDKFGTLYGSEMAGPFWLTGTQYKPSARLALAEIAKADDYAIDPQRISVPKLDTGGTDVLASNELAMSLAVMGYAIEALGGRFEPNDISLWLDHKPEVPEPGELLAKVSSAADPGAVLRKLHPTHPEFEQLRQAYLAAKGRRGPLAVTTPPPIPSGPVLALWAEDPQVEMVRERLGVPADGVKPTMLDKQLGNAIRTYLRRNGKSGRREINDDLRALLNAPQPAPKLPELRLIEANMLRWRWLPRDLGEVHIWNNIPEFETRVFKNKDVIHRERIIVGQTEQQTPIFSDKMDHIVFKPQWGVPNSIKITDLLPKLRDGDHSVLDRRGMKIVKDGREIEPDKIRWENTDIRYLNIVQGPGSWNPLGEMKFMFPNPHSVYMHDTTSRDLFANSERTFSHGCIRVRHPRKLAEVIFSQVQGWDVRLINTYLDRRAKENNRIDFEKPIPVHNVYFTLVSDRRGGFLKLPDVYGHDRRVMDALAGKSLQAIASNDPARIHKRKVEEIEKSTRSDGGSYTRRSTSTQVARSADGDEAGDVPGARPVQKLLYAADRSALGGQVPAAVRAQRPQRAASRRSKMLKSSWPPVFSFWTGD